MACHPSAERKCFICDGAHVHHLGIMNCPKMQILINEGLAMYNPQGRLVHTDGLDLSRNTIGAGDVAKFLRDERDHLNDPGPSRKGKG